MKISILLPVFNTETYLPECLDSILGQTESNWELFAIDDHSSDGSFEVLTKYAERDSRVNVLKNEGHGITNALRLAFGKSVGPLVTRMDSDDIMMPHKLEALKAKLAQNGMGHLSLGQVEYFAEDGVGEGYLRYANWLNKLTSEGNNYEEIYKECAIPSPTWMAWRSDLEQAGAFMTDIYPEDYDLAFRMRKSKLKIIPCQQVLHRWRDRPERASRTDANYRDFTFIHLKTHWFIETDHQAERPLVLWGAGRKGKRIARILNEKNISFGWVTNNPEKIGKEIRGVELREVEILRKLNNPQVIVAVASPSDQMEILDFFEKQNLAKGDNYFFFC